MPTDCRGVEIEVGDTVVRAGQGDRLLEFEVKRIERPGIPEWWVNIWLIGGGSTTPDRVAVVKKHGT